MTLSENGWTAYPDTRTFTRETANCRGGDFPFWAANKDVAVVFEEFIERWDREVEEVVGPVLDDWSYANRLVRGQKPGGTVSNHGSATAIDINALKYPLGTEHMSETKKAAARKIRREITDNNGRPVLRLGMDYSGRKDQMHLEIAPGVTARQVAEAAGKILKQEEEMALDKSDINKIADAVVNHPIPNLNPAGSPTSPASTLGGSVVDLERTQDNHNKVLSENTKAIAALATALANIQQTLVVVSQGITELLARIPAQK